MLFEPIDFQNLNETDVREEILAPLIRRLGYRSGTKNNVVREQSLRYPRSSMGRKNSKKDPILRGIADYILDADSAVRWVIEAKSPDVDIDSNSIEQAFTYANHPEVRAVYFSLCNGKEFHVFQTNRGPSCNPIVSISYDDLNHNYQIIENLLAPASLLRDHPEIKPDTGKPIGNGLRSIVRITNGVISYNTSSANIPAMNEMQITISNGAVERDEDGRLVAYLSTIAPTRSLQKLNERLGLKSFEMISVDSCISNDISEPTIFRGDQTITLPAGETLFDINTWKEVKLPINVTCRVITEASGYLEDNRFFGKFSSTMKMVNINQSIVLLGVFDIFMS